VTGASGGQGPVLHYTGRIVAARDSRAVHSWVLYNVFGPKPRELQAALEKDSVVPGTVPERGAYCNVLL
jgi:hypothetical protein